MNIKANMRVDFDSIKNTSTVATGWVEIEGIFKFPVSVRKWFDDNSFVSFMAQVRIRSKRSIRWTFRLSRENLSQLSESQVPVKVHYFICLEG